MPTSTDYRQILEGAALARTAARGLIAVSGKDRASYLQGLLTNDIQALQAGTGCYAAWLSPQGRMTADLHVLESGEMILLDVPAELTASLLQRLDQLIFSEEVTLADLSMAIVPVSVHGPGAAAVVERTLGCGPGLAEWPAYHHARAAFGEAPVVVARIDELGVPGFTLYVAAGEAALLRGALVASGARVVDEASVTAARIEAGYPLFGAELTEEIIPLEAGIEARAISFGKGCYVGQEVIIRVLHRGHGRVVRKLVGLSLDGEGAVAPDAVIKAGEREVGFVTSAAVSPERGAIALGYVHRDFLEPGTMLTVVDVKAAGAGAEDASVAEGAPADGAVADGTVAAPARSATVTALPMRPVA